jgi:hypothetical protein
MAAGTIAPVFFTRCAAAPALYRIVKPGGLPGSLARADQGRVKNCLLELQVERLPEGMQR